MREGAEYHEVTSYLKANLIPSIYCNPEMIPLLLHHFEKCVNICQSSEHNQATSQWQTCIYDSMKCDLNLMLNSKLHIIYNHSCVCMHRIFNIYSSSDPVISLLDPFGNDHPAQLVAWQKDWPRMALVRESYSQGKHVDPNPETPTHMK